jgi:hypothetical protein
MVQGPAEPSRRLLQCFGWTALGVTLSCGLEAANATTLLASIGLDPVSKFENYAFTSSSAGMFTTASIPGAIPGARELSPAGMNSEWIGSRQAVPSGVIGSTAQLIAARSTKDFIQDDASASIAGAEFNPAPSKTRGDLSLSSLPLPPVLLLLGSALAGLAIMRRRRTAPHRPGL